MTTFKKHQVVMLPAYGKAKIGDSVLGLVNGENQKLFFGKKVQDAFNCVETNFHLYILSDEEIKEGDWYYDFHNQEVCQSNFTRLPLEFGNCKKIIATTDKSLMYLESDYSCNLPKPSEEFIEYFVEEYNKGNVITEVKVEYEVDWNSKLTNMEFGFIENNMYTEQEIRDSWYTKLKINSDYTISIKPQKEKWSREEVIKFAEKYARMVQEKEIQLNAYKAIHNNKWIEENL